MCEKCKTCDGTGSVPAEVETAEGPMTCPYIGAPCPDCTPMPEKLIMVRESEWREMREALHAAQEFIANEYRDPSQQPHGEWLAPEARPAFEKLCAALAKSEAVP